MMGRYITQEEASIIESLKQERARLKLAIDAVGRKWARPADIQMLASVEDDLRRHGIDLATLTLKPVAEEERPQGTDPWDKWRREASGRGF